jgi:hypothetical protein
MANEFVDKLRGLIKPWTTGTEPLEIRRSILEDAESRVVAAGGGKRIFPYNRVTVHILAPDREERTGLEALVREGWNLREEIAGRLSERGAPVPPDLAVEVLFDDEAGPSDAGRRHYVSYERTEAAPAAVKTGRPTLELTILKGTAGQRVYTLSADRIHLGRMEEVLDHEGRVRRRNDVAFKEEGEINQTVSREHARILYDEASGKLRLRAESGASSTRIFREGRSIDVSGRDPRGVKIQSGDEIYFGRASVKVTIRA